MCDSEFSRAAPRKHAVCVAARKSLREEIDGHSRGETREVWQCNTARVRGTVRQTGKTGQYLFFNEQL